MTNVGNEVAALISDGCSEREGVATMLDVTQIKIPLGFDDQDAREGDEGELPGGLPPAPGKDTICDALLLYLQPTGQSLLNGPLVGVNGDHGLGESPAPHAMGVTGDGGDPLVSQDG